MFLLLPIRAIGQPWSWVIDLDFSSFIFKEESTGWYFRCQNETSSPSPQTYLSPKQYTLCSLVPVRSAVWDHPTPTPALLPPSTVFSVWKAARPERWVWRTTRLWVCRDRVDLGRCSRVLSWLRTRESRMNSRCVRCCRRDSVWNHRWDIPCTCPLFVDGDDLSDDIWLDLAE